MTLLRGLGVASDDKVFINTFSKKICIAKVELALMCPHPWRFQVRLVKLRKGKHLLLQVTPSAIFLMYFLNFGAAQPIPKLKSAARVKTEYLIFLEANGVGSDYSSSLRLFP